MTSDFISKINLDLIKYCGYVEGAEVHADGSYDNDLALDRADAVLDFLKLVKRHSNPSSLLPRPDRTLELGDGVNVHTGPNDRIVQGEVKALGNLSGALVVVIDGPVLMAGDKAIVHDEFGDDVSATVVQDGGQLTVVVDQE